MNQPMTASMITTAYVQCLARYNHWQNENLYGCAARLPDSERKRGRGAFFGSIQGTLCHIVFADQAWLNRFAPEQFAPSQAKSIAESATAIDSWDTLVATRRDLDVRIISWCGSLTDVWLSEDLTWFSGATQRHWAQPKGMLFTHFFNHQTHHRGQVHCMLTQSGIKPGDTDLPFMAT